MEKQDPGSLTKQKPFLISRGTATPNGINSQNPSTSWLQSNQGDFALNFYSNPNCIYCKLGKVRLQSNIAYNKPMHYDACNTRLKCYSIICQILRKAQFNNSNNLMYFMSYFHFSQRHILQPALKTKDCFILSHLWPPLCWLWQQLPGEIRLPLS